MWGRVKHPARLIPAAFALFLVLGTLVLMLPVSVRDTAHPAPPLVAAFTAVSATCITGLAVVDTATYWSPFGQAVILAMIQVGGFGIMTLATLLAFVVTGRLNLSSTLTLQVEGKARSLGSVVQLLRTVLLTMVGIEALVALALALRFHLGYGYGPGKALWHGLFHGISSFNNAGFALYSDSLIGFARDAWILGPICLAVIVGGLGFPLFLELGTRWRRPRELSVHSKLTVLGYGALFVVGVVGFALFEWGNPATLGRQDWWGKALGAVAGGVFPRTVGFNAIDYGLARPETLLLGDLLMFVGGGSAGTSGGIKVGTFAILAFVIWAEIRGENDVVIGARRIPEGTIRQAISVALLGLGVVALGTFVLLASTDHSLDKTLFEVVSAFGTTGLSTGITPTLPPVAQVTLMVLMFVGRVGTVTFATALALNTTHRKYHHPIEQPLVG